MFTDEEISEFRRELERLLIEIRMQDLDIMQLWANIKARKGNFKDADLRI